MRWNTSLSRLSIMCTSGMCFLAMERWLLTTARDTENLQVVSSSAFCVLETSNLFRKLPTPAPRSCTPNASQGCETHAKHSLQEPVTAATRVVESTYYCHPCHESQTQRVKSPRTASALESIVRMLKDVHTLGWLVIVDNANTFLTYMN